jgi:hypothetical protein
VIVFQSDRAAPIGAKRKPRPNGNGHAQRGDDYAKPPEKRPVRKKWQKEPGKQLDAAEEKPEGEEERSEVENALKWSLRTFHLFYRESHCDPDKGKDPPEPTNKLHGEVW